jgi:putative membrane protein
MNAKTMFALMLALASTAAAAETVAEKFGANSALGVAPKTQFYNESRCQRHDRDCCGEDRSAEGRRDESQFADQMVKDHIQTSTELKALVSSGHVQATLHTATSEAGRYRPGA